jgi:hypothetical protein
MREEAREARFHDQIANWLVEYGNENGYRAWSGNKEPLDARSGRLRYEYRPDAIWERGGNRVAFEVALNDGHRAIAGEITLANFARCTKIFVIALPFDRTKEELEDMVRMVAESVEAHRLKYGATLIAITPQVVENNRIEEAKETIQDVLVGADWIKREKLGEIQYWITPVRRDERSTAENVIRTLVKENGIYAFGENTPGRASVKPGDWICFYASGSGVVAHAKVSSKPERKPHPKVRDSERHPWTFEVSDVDLYLDKPIGIDASMRQRLDAFSKIDPTRPWGWFVVTTRALTKNDFVLLTGQSGRPKQ